MEKDKLVPGLVHDLNGDVYDEITGTYQERCENCGDYYDPSNDIPYVGLCGFCEENKANYGEEDDDIETSELPDHADSFPAL